MRRRSPLFLLALAWASLWGVSTSSPIRVDPPRPAEHGSSVENAASPLLAHAIASAGRNGADFSSPRDPQPHRRPRVGAGAAGAPTFALRILLPAQAVVTRVGFQLRHSHALARRVAAGQTALPPPVV